MNMPSTVTVSTVSIRAKPDAVWSALTEPEHIKAWQYGADLETTWQAGSPIRFTATWREGDREHSFAQWGTVLTYDPPRSLSYTLFAPRPDLADIPENYFTMTYALERAGDETIVTLSMHDPRPTSRVATGDYDDNGILAALATCALALAETS